MAAARNKRNFLQEMQALVIGDWQKKRKKRAKTNLDPKTNYTARRSSKNLREGFGLSENLKILAYWIKIGTL